jgi:hypothetical protein
MYTDTKTATASFYFDDSGKELHKEDWIKEYFIAFHQYGQHGYMLYIGDGFVPLTAAVIAYNESDAVETFEEWCRNNNRTDEIGEGEDYQEACRKYDHQVASLVAAGKEDEVHFLTEPEPEYSLHIEIIPEPKVTMG